MIIYNTPIEMTTKDVKIESRYFKTILKLEDLFKTSEKSFILNNSYDSTIVYTEFLEEFKELMKTDINSLKFFMSILDLYKRVYVRCKHYERPEHKVVLCRTNNSDIAL